MRVLRLTAEELSEDTAKRLRAHSCFASPGFANLWQSVGGRAVCWAIEIDSRIAAILPAVEFGRKPLLRLQAMPDGCYASLVLNDSDLKTTEVEKICTAMLSAIAGYGYARVFISDQQNQFTATEKFQTQLCTTTLVDISSPDWKPAERNVGTEVRAAQRRGVQAISFERDRHFDSFLALIEKIKEGPQRFPKNPKRFYSALANLSEIDSRIRWLVIEHEEKVIASLIGVIEREMMLAWHGCFDREFGSAFKPNNLLFHAMVTLAQSESVRFFNLGSTPPGATGAETFKKKWGGTAYEYQTLVLKSGLGKLR